MEATWQPRKANWSARALFSNLRRADVALSDKKLAELEDYFWFDLCAEWDSRYLHHELHRSGKTWSQPFLDFEQAWYDDEINHAEGFIAIYSHLYGETKESIRKRLNQRSPDFADVSRFLKDEFEVAVLFAYDELATMRAYRLDLDLYQSLGPRESVTWLHRLMKDETYHHKNAFDIACRRYPERLDEVPDLIQGFLDYDLENPSYKATFIFDHEWDHVDDGFFRETGEILKQGFARAQEKILQQQ